MDLAAFVLLTPAILVVEQCGRLNMPVVLRGGRGGQLGILACDAGVTLRKSPSKKT